MKKATVAVNGCNVIGKGVADAVRRQEEMEPSWRRFARKKATDAKEGNTHAANHENIRHEKDRFGGDDGKTDC